MPDQTAPVKLFEYYDMADFDATYHMARRSNLMLAVNDPDVTAVLVAGCMAHGGDRRGEHYLQEMHTCFEADYDQSETNEHARRVAGLLMAIDFELYDAGKAPGPERLLISLNRFLDECPPSPKAVYRPGVDTVKETLLRAEWPLRAASLLEAAGIPELDEEVGLGIQIFFNTIANLFDEVPTQGPMIYRSLKEMYEFINETTDGRLVAEFEERMTTVLEGVILDIDLDSLRELPSRMRLPRSIGLHVLADLIERNPDDASYKRQLEVLRSGGFGTNDADEIEQAEREIAISRLMSLGTV